MCFDVLALIAQLSGNLKDERKFKTKPRSDSLAPDATARGGAAWAGRSRQGAVASCLGPAYCSGELFYTNQTCLVTRF